MFGDNGNCHWLSMSPNTNGHYILPSTVEPRYNEVGYNKILL